MRSKQEGLLPSCRSLPFEELFTRFEELSRGMGGKEPGAQELSFHFVARSLLQPSSSSQTQIDLVAGLLQFEPLLTHVLLAHPQDLPPSTSSRPQSHKAALKHLAPFALHVALVSLPTSFLSDLRQDEEEGALKEQVRAMLMQAKVRLSAPLPLSVYLKRPYRALEEELIAACDQLRKEGEGSLLLLTPSLIEQLLSLRSSPKRVRAREEQEVPSLVSAMVGSAVREMEHKQQLIGAIEAVRSRNNVNWMDLLRLAFRVAPLEAKKIMAKIDGDDRLIASYLKELSS